MTPRRYLILSLVILCAVVSAQQAVFWRSDAARTEASQRLDAARVQQLALSQLQRSLDDVRHAVDQATLTTTLSGAVPSSALGRNREDLTSSLARLAAPPGTVAARDVADLTAAVNDFFREWDADPGGSITAAVLPDAIARFSALAERELARLPEADRALERTRLLGSLVAPGIALRVFELEADTPGAIARRLLETDLKGPFDFPQLGGLKTRTVEIHGKADRIDLLESGALRVVDYKLSRLPDRVVGV